MLTRGRVFISMKKFIKAITRAEYDSFPESVKFFCPPFDVLRRDHYEEQRIYKFNYSIEELIKYFSNDHRKPQDERKAGDR